MAQPQTAVPRESGPGYLDWERHQASIRGLRALSAVGAMGSAGLLVADLLLFREERVVEAIPAPAVWGALVLGFVAAVAMGASTLSRRGEVPRPMIRAGTLMFFLIGVGALAAASAGGVDGYYPFGLLPLLMVWTATMPAGSTEAAFPLLGSLALHLFVLRIAVPGIWGPRAVGLAVLLLILVASGVVLAEVVERLRRQRALLSRLDPLTGVFHREGLMNELKILCSRRARQQAPVSLVLFDLDRFRLLNGAHGRAFGDQVLEMMGALVRNSVRAHDLVGRCGPDEFLLVLDGCDGDHAVQLIKRIRSQLLERPIPVAGESVRVTLSAGIICAAAGVPLTPEDLLASAEQALQASKEAQLNRTYLGAPTDSQPPTAAMSPAVVWNFPAAPLKDDERRKSSPELAAVDGGGPPADEGAAPPRPV